MASSGTIDLGANTGTGTSTSGGGGGGGGSGTVTQINTNGLISGGPITTTGTLSVGSVSLANEVRGSLPLSQTTGSISLTTQVSGILPSGNLPSGIIIGSVSLTTQVSGVLPVANGGAGNAVTFGKHAVWIPANSFIPTTTDGAQVVASQTSVNHVMQTYAQFTTSTNESVQFAIQWPTSLGSSSFTYKYVWSHGTVSTSYGVSFIMRPVSIGDNEPVDTVFDGGGLISDTGGTVGNLYISAESAPVTISSLTAVGEMVFFRINRDNGDAGNTFLGTARIYGITLFTNVVAAVDV